MTAHPEALTHERVWATRVLSDLERLGAHNGYLWPPQSTGPRTTHRGYSYDVPKEEQVRAYLVRAIEEKGNLVAEVDWTWYRSPKQKWKLDVATFATTNRDDTLPQHLIEVKRVWRLQRLGWFEKPPELVESLKKDQRRLEEVRHELAAQFPSWRPRSVGLFIIELLDSPSATFDFGDMPTQLLTEQPAVLTAARDAPVELNVRAHWLSVLGAPA